MKRIFSFTFSILLFLQSTFGCTLLPNYISKFDKTEYVFIGEVIGYTDPIEFEGKYQISVGNDNPYKLAYKQASGLIVRVKATINLPKRPKTHFEVFPFDLDAGCGTLGIQKFALKNRFPLNSEILVVVNEATIFPHVLENGNFRLEQEFARSNVIALNADKKNRQLTNVSSIFEYSQLNEDFDIGKNYYLFDFEARKDLLRLQLSKTQMEKVAVINRLLENPTRAIDYLELLKTNVKDRQEVLSNYEKRLRFENAFYLKLYKKEIYSEEDIQKRMNDVRKKLQSNNKTRKSKSK